MRPENQHTLDCMKELGAISSAEELYYVQFCPNTDEVIDRLSVAANAVIGSRDHYQHLIALEEALSNHAYEAIPRCKQSMFCYLMDVRFYRAVIAAACDGNDELMDRNGTRLLRSINRSFEAVARATEREINVYLDQWRENARRHEARMAECVTELNRVSNAIFTKFYRTQFPKNTFKKATRAFQRSYRLAQSIMGRKRLDQFIRDRILEVDGQLYRYQLTLTTESLLGSGSHGQTALTVLTLDGNEVCNLCLYSTNCTLLDHACSIYVHVTTGEELAILQTANVFNVREGYEKDADFIRGQPLMNLDRIPRIDPEILIDIDRQARVRQEERERRIRYLIPQIQTLGVPERYHGLCQPFPENFRVNRNVGRPINANVADTDQGLVVEEIAVVAG